MISTRAAISALLLLAATTAFSQEEAEPSPTPRIPLRASDQFVAPEPSDADEESAETPGRNYPKPGATTSTPAPAAKPSPSPAAGAKPTPTAAPAATAKPLPTGNVPATIRELENRWLTAIKNHDVAAVQALLADNYIGVSATGRFVNKASLLADMRKDKNTYDSATNSGLTVRVHGDTAVIVGTTRQVGKDPAGKAFTYTYRWTDTWVFRGGTWQCAASQSILVPR